MAVTDVVRPISVRKTGAGTSVPSGTLAAVTSDNSDATYIDFNLVDSGSNWSLRVGPHTPATDYQRHQVRARVRIRTDTGTLNEDIDLGRGVDDYLDYTTVSVTSAFAEQVTDWYSSSDYGLATVGALSDLNIGGGYPANATGGAGELRTAECYVDIDCRHKPDFTPEIRDAAGVNRNGGTVTDTNQPTFYFGSVSYDGLPALNWFANVRATQFGAAIFDVGEPGAPPTTVDVTAGLPDGAYWAVWGVRSTIRGSDSFESVVYAQFTVANTVPPPSPPLVSVTEESGGYRVTWTDPGGQGWDDDYVVTEVYRDDCNGSQRIATVPDSLSGSYLDLAIPQLDPQLVSGPDCELSSPACDITYRVRYWGYISTSVTLPSTIPDDLILGWPGTVGTIPSGWSRVTALDGYFPYGSSGTGAPTTTGGAANHSHTTAAHSHTIGAHSHSLGGSTGTSNSSTTSARFNGASQPQADQPHSHSRPSSTGSANPSTSGSNTPATSVVNNDPPARTVIWIRSDGLQAAYPAGVLGWATESVSGWTADTNSAGRFLKGAAAAGNGGANSGASTHIHTINSHSHTGVAHDHSIGSTGLSNPSSSQEAGYGSSTPRWLPRHTHPMDVVNETTGTVIANGGGDTSSATLEPPNRRLSVLRNTGGGIQTRIIGIYNGTVAALDPLLTLCNGSGGTPDMRAWFARDAGSDSVNSTGGASSHTHTVSPHAHALPTHAHDTNVNASTTGSFEAPSTGDLGDSPTTGHTHSSGDTGGTAPAVTNASAGAVVSASNLPVYKEAHFVRLDGTISGGPLAVPQLKTSDFASATVPSATYGDGLDRLANFSTILAVATDRSHSFPRLVADSTPLDGGLHTVSTTLAGEDVTLIMATEGLPAINALEALLASDRLYYSPVGGTSGWFAPGSWSVTAPVPNVKVVQILMVRQNWPATPDPAVYL